MNKKKMTTEQLREVKGNRLKELLRISNLSQSELIRLTEEKFGEAYSISPPHLSDIIHGRRTLTEQFAVKFAYILEADPGYLTGSDGYQAENYTEYNNVKQKSYEVTYGKYDFLLRLIGYRVFSFVSDEKSHGYFGIQHNNDISFVSGHELEECLEDVFKYMELRIRPLLLEHKISTEELSDFEWVFSEKRGE